MQFFIILLKFKKISLKEKASTLDGVFSLSDDLENTFSINHLMEEENNLIEHEYNLLLSAIKNSLND